jgi:hypothetical protein
MLLQVEAYFLNAPVAGPPVRSRYDSQAQVINDLVQQIIDGNDINAAHAQVKKKCVISTLFFISNRSQSV